MNASTLVPAAAVVPNTSSDAGVALSAAETIQLTDTVLTNLTDISLDNATLFAFDDEPASTVEKRSGSCKVYPGDAAWPSPIVWWLFDLVLGGRLITTVPSASSCYNSWHDYSSSECDYVNDQWANSTFQ